MPEKLKGADLRRGDGLTRIKVHLLQWTEFVADAATWRKRAICCETRIDAMPL